MKTSILIAALFLRLSGGTPTLNGEETLAVRSATNALATVRHLSF